MQATFTTKVQVRETPSAASRDVGDVNISDVIYGNVSGGWISFNKIYRGGKVIEVFPAIYYAAIQDPNNALIKYATLKDIPEPLPTPEPPAVKPLIVTIEGESYKTVVVTLEPK